MTSLLDLPDDILSNIYKITIIEELKNDDELYDILYDNILIDIINNKTNLEKNLFTVIDLFEIDPHMDIKYLYEKYAISFKKINYIVYIYHQDTIKKLYEIELKKYYIKNENPIKYKDFYKKICNTLLNIYNNEYLHISIKFLHDFNRYIQLFLDEHIKFIQLENGIYVDNTDQIMKEIIDYIFHNIINNSVNSESRFMTYLSNAIFANI